MFDKKQWAQKALDSQSACNPSGLLHAALACLKEWREGGGDFNGSECLPFRFICYQIGYLNGANQYDATGGFGLYGEHTKKLEAMAKGETVTHA